MDSVSIFLADLLASLTARLPHRIVTGEFINHPERKAAELQSGVVTILLGDIDPDDDAWHAELELKIVGQIKVPERGEGSGPAAVQAAELKLWQELMAALRNPGPGFPKLKPGKAKFSCQLEAPYGWVAMPLAVGTIDLATGDESIDYPPTTSIGEFLHLHADLDIEPFASATTHKRWVDEQPATEQPELTATVELQS